MEKQEKRNVQVPKAEFVTRLLRLPRGISRLEKYGQKKKVPKDYMLVEAGDIPKYCFIIKTGRAICYEYSISGEERIYNFNENNSLLMESYVLFDTVVPVNVKTVLPSEIIFIDKETLLQAISTDPEICKDIMQSLHMKFHTSMEQIRHANFHNAGWKICDLLLMFAEKYGVDYDGKILIKEKISQQLLSNLLGINRVTAVRAIKELKDMSLIEQVNGYYCIRDVEKLKRHQERLIR
ncbi:MAG: Crp/Fnr family transcriptional regulator [Lachnospiraceae bacterium]|nr:Crp/Fnr family transcriptional regulator [Lachnospiraceae bacterium]